LRFRPYAQTNLPTPCLNYFCAWLPHSYVMIVTRFAAAVAAGLCSSGRIAPELLSAGVAHLRIRGMPNPNAEIL